MKKILLFLSLSMILALASVASASAADRNFDFNKKMNLIAGNYLNASDLLAEDRVDGVEPYAENIIRLAETLKPEETNGELGKHSKEIALNVSESALDLSIANDLDSARSAFAKLSNALVTWSESSKEPNAYLIVACNNDSVKFLQLGAVVKDPFAGAQGVKPGATCKISKGRFPVRQADPFNTPDSVLRNIPAL